MSNNIPNSGLLNTLSADRLWLQNLLVCGVMWIACKIEHFRNMTPLRREQSSMLAYFVVSRLMF